MNRAKRRAARAAQHRAHTAKGAMDIDRMFEIVADHFEAVTRRNLTEARKRFKDLANALVIVSTKPFWPGDGGLVRDGVHIYIVDRDAFAESLRDACAFAPNTFTKTNDGFTRIAEHGMIPVLAFTETECRLRALHGDLS